MSNNTKIFNQKSVKRWLIFYICLSITTILTISCEKKALTIIPSAIHPKLLVKESIPNNCYYYAFTFDSTLILLADCDSIYFKTFNKNTLKHLKHFGNKGKGPNEFGSPLPFKTNTVMMDRNRRQYFYNLTTPQISSIDFLLINKENFILSSLLDKNLFLATEINQLEDEKYAGIDMSNPKGLFFIYDQISKKKKWIGFSPKTTLISNKKMIVSYNGSLSSNASNIYFANKFFDEITFYNSNGDLLKKFNFSDIKLPLISKEYEGLDQETMIYFGKSFATKNHCYISRINQKRNLVQTKKEFSTQILVFNWQGTLEKCLQLESLPYCFCIDEAENILYTIEINGISNDSLVNIAKYSLN